LTPTPDILEPRGPDTISVRAWFALFGLFLVATVTPLALLLARQQWVWTWDPAEIGRQLGTMSAATKLLGFLVYVSLCCTFLPLPTGPIVSAVAMQQVAVTGEIWTTTLVVAAVGAAGSTIANLNDYHLFTWVLRSRHVARVRHTRIYRLGARWFARSPYLILVIFNVIPIPVDVVRMLATTYRYPRVPFATANYIGRFVRYGVIAWVTYRLGEKGWIASVALLAVAVALGARRVVPPVVRKLLRRRPNETATKLSNLTKDQRR